MQFELISCFRWSLANQGRQDTEVGTIKLTTPRPWLFKKGKTKQPTRSPHPRCLSQGKPRASPTQAEQSSSHPPQAQRPTCPQCPFVAAYLTLPNRVPFLSGAC